MTLTERIIDLLREEKLVDATNLTETVLYSKLSDIISEKYEDISPTLFGEAKKAKVTDKDDDGEGMDPVGHGDDDIDNDGDSDDTDDYLKNRRKAIGKAIQKEDEDVEETTTYGVSKAAYSSKKPEQKSMIRQKHFRDKEKMEREKERERKVKEREANRADMQRGEG